MNSDPLISLSLRVGLLLSLAHVEMVSKFYRLTTLLHNLHFDASAFCSFRKMPERSHRNRHTRHHPYDGLFCNAVACIALAVIRLVRTDRIFPSVPGLLRLCMHSILFWKHPWHLSQANMYLRNCFCPDGSVKLVSCRLF